MGEAIAMTIKRYSIGCAKKLLCSLLAGGALICMLSDKGWSMLVPVQEAASVGQASDRSADIKTVQSALESKMVRARLKNLGMTDKESESRLNRLSDQQVHQLAKNINTLSPGGDIGLVLAFAIILVVIVFLSKL